MTLTNKYTAVHVKATDTTTDRVYDGYVPVIDGHFTDMTQAVAIAHEIPMRFHTGKLHFELESEDRKTKTILMPSLFPTLALVITFVERERYAVEDLNV